MKIKEKINVFIGFKGIKWLCLTSLFLVITLWAWQADDAFHAYKMSYNFANGNGLVYNVGERVSASTCPLHTIIVGILYKLTGGIMQTTKTAKNSPSPMLCMR